MWEWVEDCYHDRYDDDAPKDGSAWESGSCEFRVVRGGSWNYSPDYLRSASRNWDSPFLRYNSLGVRLARTLP